MYVFIYIYYNIYFFLHLSSPFFTFETCFPRSKDRYGDLVARINNANKGIIFEDYRPRPKRPAYAHRCWKEFGYWDVIRMDEKTFGNFSQQRVQKMKHGILTKMNKRPMNWCIRYDGPEDKAMSREGRGQ